MKRQRLYVGFSVILCLITFGLGALPRAKQVDLSLDTNLEDLASPLVFEENRGQAPGEFLYLARGKQFTLYLSGSGAHFISADLKSIQISWERGNPESVPEPQELLPGRSNYFLGQNLEDWITNVPQYRKVRYRDIYPGIDLVFYGNPDQLEYDFVVAPGADPEQILLSFEGSENIRISQGRLIVETALGELVQHQPLVYQFEQGERVPIVASYHIEGRLVSFTLGEFNSDRELVLDPVLAYSSYWGGSGGESSGGIALDPLGNVVLVGHTWSADFPQLKALDTDLGGNTDVFVSKFDPTGRILLFSTFLGGEGSDWDPDVAIGPDGSIYLLGMTESTDFPLSNAFQPVYAGGVRFPRDYFVTRLSPNGDSLMFSTYLGGSGDEGQCNGGALAVDSNGNAYIGGDVGLGGTDYPVVNPFKAQGGGAFYDMVISRISPAGVLTYSTYFGGDETERPGRLGASNCAGDIAVDSQGAIYVAGHSDTSDFPLKDPVQSEIGGEEDLVLFKLDPATNTLHFSTYLGGSDDDNQAKLAVRADGSAFLLGQTRSADFPVTAGAVDSVIEGPDEGDNPEEVTLSAFGPAGELIYSTYLGGQELERSGALILGPSGELMISGWTRSPDFPLVDPIPGALMGDGVDDAFVTVLSPEGSAILFSTRIGGSGGGENGVGLAVSGEGDLWVTGTTNASDFPTFDPIQSENAGNSDVFLVRIAGLTFSQTDADADGAADSVEDGAPNNGDGNDDGTADSEQAHVASLPSSSTQEYVTLASSAGSTLASVKSVSNPSPSDLPPGVSFPLGCFEFMVQGIAAGSATSVDLFVPAEIELDTYYKYGPTPTNSTPHWYEFLFDGTTGAELLEDRVVLHFVDGQRGDDDLSANGEITEPGGPAQVLSAFYFPQFADGAVGTLKFQSTLILVNTGSDTDVQVELFSTPDGNPMAMTLGNLGTDSLFEMELGEGESISLTTPGTAGLQVGYARVFAGPDVGGVVVFQRTDLTTGVSLYEAGVPASKELTEFSLFVDSLGVRDTGFALVYPPQDNGSSPAETSDATVTVRLYDKQFNFIAEKTLDPLSPGSHMAKFVYELFDDPQVKAQAQEMEGILTVESDQPLVAVTVRQNDHPQKEFPEEVPILTTFPVIPGTPE